MSKWRKMTVWPFENVQVFGCSFHSPMSAGTIERKSLMVVDSSAGMFRRPIRDLPPGSIQALQIADKHKEAVFDEPSPPT
jgi:hypothetical protein